MDTIFSQNLRFLRKRLTESVSQAKFAEEMGINKSTYNTYETGRAEPKYEELVRFAKYFEVSIDDFLTNVLTEETFKPKFSGQTNLRILVTTVNAENEDNIEFVPIKAVAGYSNGYGDIEYIEQLPTFNVPFLDKNKKYRVFPIQGDSMLPMQEGSKVFAEYIEDWQNIKSGTICIVVTKNEGIVLKKVYNYLTDSDLLLLESKNERYDPYPVKAEDVQEIWKFAGFYSPDFPSE